MNFRPIFYINGILLLILSAFMLLPVFADLIMGNPDWRVFASAQIITAFTGFAMIFSNRQKKFSMTVRETFLLTCLCWFMMALFGTLPLYFSKIDISFAKAFFESTSGITTTGSTVLSGLDSMPHGILLWRHIMQWLGGIGFLVIALAVLPMLQVSGMQIYKTQSFGEVDKVLPSASQMAIYIFLIYSFLTFVCAILYHAAGMTGFDALCHALSTVSTAGYSTHDASIGYFKSATIDYICIFFMLAGAFPFVLYLKFIRGDHTALHRDSQVRSAIGIWAALILLVASYLMITGRFFPQDALRNATFMITTLMTTTGFSNADYTLWGEFIIAIAFLATFLGFCSGSTTGGIKIFRLQILWSMMVQQLRQLMNPHGIFQVHYNKKLVDISVQASIAGFIFVYLASWIFFGVLLQLVGLDFVTAFTGSLTAISNVGPGLGHVIGPAGNFATLPDSAVWILSVAMLLGRLEFFTLLVILTPRFWRQ